MFADWGLGVMKQRGERSYVNTARRLSVSSLWILEKRCFRGRLLLLAETVMATALTRLIQVTLLLYPSSIPAETVELLKLRTTKGTNLAVRRLAAGLLL